MTAVGITQPRESFVGKWWWVLLVMGILWILIGLFILQAHYESAVVIGYFVGFWLLFAGIAEFVEIGIVDRWRWLHAILGVLFVLGGIGALLSPFQTFTILAAFIGFFLVLKGQFGISTRDAQGAETTVGLRKGEIFVVPRGNATSTTLPKIASCKR